MSLKKWFDNARSVSLVQSVMPSVLAVVLAIGKEGFHWWDAVLAVVGVACAHLAMNLTDDYFDYKVDMLGDRDKVTRQGFRAMLVKYPYLTDGSQTLKSTAVAIASFIIAALCCGGVILLDRWGTPVFAPMGLLRQKGELTDVRSKGCQFRLYARTACNQGYGLQDRGRRICGTAGT